MFNIEKPLDKDGKPFNPSGKYSHGILRWVCWDNFFTLGSPEAFVCDSYLDPFECRITPRSQKTVKVVQEL